MAKCDNPFTLKETGMQFPCGKCLPCRNRRASGWSFRLRKELEHSDSAFFVTLTYNTDEVPISNKGYMSLDKKHLQLFFKRIRKAQNDNKIKYYTAGEYGSDKDRPHYHSIIFNMDLSILLDIPTARHCLKSPEMYLNGKYQFMSKHWKYGVISIGTVTMASIGYCLKYITKPSKIPKHNNDDREKEFQLMSKGLGKKYITEEVIFWHHDDINNRMYLPVEDKKKLQYPGT